MAARPPGEKDSRTEDTTLGSTDVSNSFCNTVYNVLGQQVKTLLDEPRRAGSHRIDWDGTNQTGRQVSTGLYLYRIEAGDFTDTKKMLLLR